MIFRDYYDQFFETINYIRYHNKNTYWIVKPHPARSQYHEQGIIEELLKNIKMI